MQPTLSGLVHLSARYLVWVPPHGKCGGVQAIGGSCMGLGEFVVCATIKVNNKALRVKVGFLLLYIKDHMIQENYHNTPGDMLMMHDPLLLWTDHVCGWTCCRSCPLPSSYSFAEIPWPEADPCCQGHLGAESFQWRLWPQTSISLLRDP